MTEISTRRNWRFVAATLVALMAAPAMAQDNAQLDLGSVTRDFLQLFRSSTSGGFLAGQQAMKELRTDEAARYFNDIARADWENPLLVERAFVALAADGQIDEAAEAAAQLHKLQPGSELAELVIATEALKAGRYGEIEAELEAIGQDSFSGITAGIMRGWALVGAGKPDEAQALMERLGADGLEDFLVFHRALMADVAGDTEIALDFAQKAFDTEPYVPRIAEAYATMLVADGQKDAAIDVLDTFAEQGITHPTITLLREKIEADEPLPPFAETVQVGAAEMFHGIGAALTRDGSGDLALVFLRLAHFLDADSDVVAMTIGELLDQAGQHDAANVLYDAIPAASPIKPTAVVRIAQNLDAKGERDEAIRRLSNIVSLNPEDLQAVSTLGDLQSAAESWPEAAEAYSAALQLAGLDRPGSWALYYVRGIAYERAGEWPKAEADFQKALELNPDQPAVLNYLGYSWIDMDMNLDEALGMIEKAVEQRPDDGYIIDSLGWAFYKLDRMDEAVEVLERAVSLLPNDPELNDHLGDAYLAVGRENEALFQWNIAVAVDAVGTVTERAAPKIAKATEERQEREAARRLEFDARKAAEAKAEPVSTEAPPAESAEPAAETEAQ